MGGLRKKLPVTFWTMTRGSGHRRLLPFCRILSKDAISTRVFAGTTARFSGLLPADGVVDSFYMFRLWYLTFMASRAAPSPST